MGVRRRFEDSLGGYRTFPLTNSMVVALHSGAFFLSFSLSLIISLFSLPTLVLSRVRVNISFLQAGVR